ncbi:MAG: zinc-binding dehydrogenase [Lentisphaeria bacterium]|nr:zinc-binding dehydrogenase [Lentisphaeria bacterium]
MKRTVAVVTTKGEVIARREDVRELKDNEVLIDVECSLISPGTEMNLPRMRRETPGGKDVVFGYANAGTIIATKGDVKNLKKGMRVAAMGGGFAVHGSVACVPVNLVMPIPDSVTFEQAAYACLGVTAMQGVRRADVSLGSYGMVLGLGLVGNLACQLFQAAGARVIGWEGLSQRIKIAKKCGIANTVNFKRADAVEATKAFCAPYGADFAMLAFGGNATAPLQSAMNCMKVSADGHAMGNIVLIGGAKLKLAAVPGPATLISVLPAVPVPDITTLPGNTAKTILTLSSSSPPSATCVNLSICWWKRRSKSIL